MTTETRVRFLYDDNPLDPREDENVGHMVCWHRRHTLGDDQPALDPQEWREAFEAENPTHVLLPLFLMDHSGITMSVGPFSCPWDSGQVGWIYATPADAERVSVPWDVEKITEYLTSEVQTYSTYIEGGVWGYVIQRGEECNLGHTHWEHVDSCWGFYGYDLEESGALDHIGDEHHEIAIKQWDTVGVETP
jgi:hypothetical protein